MVDIILNMSVMDCCTVYICSSLLCCVLCFIRIHLKRKATEQSGGKAKKQKKSTKQKLSQRNPATKKGGKNFRKSGKNKKQFTKKHK